ncbi:hypothetical protein [Streptomyces sp. NPDC059874]|uniref:hypothetical protein n=1 Tax=Streptomyces sp. NPDC059874 TaxID=3346983 RepID=UPI00366881C1
MTQHWHAFAYTGRSYPDALIRRREVPANYPPIEIKHWLDRPASQVVDTFRDIESAVSWLEGELTQNPAADEEHFSVVDRLEYSRETLGLKAGNDVVYGYYSKAQQYVSRALIACPRGETRSCPYGSA